MKTILACTSLIGLFGWTSLLAEDPSQRSDVLQTTDRIRAEERRQGDVSRQLNASTREIERLLEDLKSNNLSERGKWQVHDKMKTDLNKVNKERVGSATKNLKQARLQLSDAYQHLDKADEDVIEVIKALNKILRENEESITADLLLEQIRALIKRENFLRRETERWGKVLLINEDEAAADKPRVVRAQGGVLQQLETFKFKLDDAADDAIDESLVRRFREASQKYQETKPDLSLEDAIGTIRQDDAFSAVGHQASAIKALEEIETILASDDDKGPSKEDVLEELERILEEQIGLKEKTEDAGKELEDASQLQAEQLDLRKDLEKASTTFNTTDCKMTSHVERFRKHDFTY